MLNVQHFKFAQFSKTSWHRLHYLDSHLFFCLLLILPLIIPQCNNNEIRPGKHIGVCISVANNRLFVGSIPKSKTKEQIVEEFAKVTGESAPYFLLCVCNINSTASILHFKISSAFKKPLAVCVQMMTHYCKRVTFVTMKVYR